MAELDAQLLGHGVGIGATQGAGTGGQGPRGQGAVGGVGPEARRAASAVLAGLPPKLATQFVDGLGGQLLGLQWCAQAFLPAPPRVSDCMGPSAGGAAGLCGACGGLNLRVADDCIITQHQAA